MSEELRCQTGADSVAVSPTLGGMEMGLAGSADRVWIIVLISGFLGLMVDGMDLMFLSYSLPSLMPELGISKMQAGSLASFSLLGMALGGVVGGWAADRFGRVRTVVWTIVLFSIGTAALGFTQSYWQFAMVRFVSSLGLGAEYVVCNTLMAEYVPTNRRTTILGTLQAGWSVGYVVATLLAGAIIPRFGWRWLFATATVPVLLAVFIRRTVPEPKGWQMLAAKKAAARSAAKSPEKSPASKPAASPWRVLLSNPRQRMTFLWWTLTAAFLQFGY